MTTQILLYHGFVNFLAALKDMIRPKSTFFGRLGISPNTLENWIGYAAEGKPKAEIAKVASVLKGLEIGEDVAGLDGWFDAEGLGILKTQLKSYGRPVRKWWHDYLDNERIQSHVPPSIQPSATTLSFEALKRSGVLNTFRIPVRNELREVRVAELVTHELQKKDPRFRLLASSGKSYLHPQGAVWLAGLGQALRDRRARLEAVIQSPFSLFSLTRALANDVSWNQWEDTGMHRRLEELNDTPYDKLPISVHVTGVPINASLFITSDSVFYDPYLWASPKVHGRTENQYWVFEFGRTNEPEYDCYNLLVGHFDFLREHSLPLKSMMKKYADTNKEFNTLLDECRRKEGFLNNLNEDLVLNISRNIMSKESSSRARREEDSPRRKRPRGS